jgi:hypothetical protein
MEGGNELSYAPIVDLPDGVYNYGPREKKDRLHGVSFGLAFFSVLGLGVYAVKNVNPHYEKLADPSLMKVGSWRRSGSDPRHRLTRRGGTFPHFFAPSYFFVLPMGASRRGEIEAVSRRRHYDDTFPSAPPPCAREHTVASASLWRRNACVTSNHMY